MDFEYKFSYIVVKLMLLALLLLLFFYYCGNFPLGFPNFLDIWEELFYFCLMKKYSAFLSEKRGIGMYRDDIANRS